MRVILFIALILWGSHRDSFTQERSSIWAGKGEINLGKSVPGVIEIRGNSAFPVLKDIKGATLAAAGVAGKGRVVAFSHGSFIKNVNSFEQQPVVDLWLNLAKWAGYQPGSVVGVHPSTTGIQSFLTQQKIKSLELDPESLQKQKPSIYCLFPDDNRLTDSDIELIETYLTNGGGVIVATTPWAFAKRFPNFDESPGNRILSKAGLYFQPRSYCSNRSPVLVSRPIESFLPTERTWENGEVPASNDPSVLAARALADSKEQPSEKLVTQLLKGKTLSGQDIPAYLQALKELNLSLGGITPTKKSPVVPGKNPVIDAIIEIETHLNSTLPAGMMYPIPAASDYPGAVPDDAAIITKSLSLNCNYKGWATQRNAAGWNAKEIRPTGIYAPPGAVIKVTVPELLVAKGYGIAIGSYGRGLDNRAKWHRYPRTQKNQPIRNIETEVSNGFGGLVGIWIPQNVKDGSHPITIEGGVAAPLYEHGITSLDDWKENIRLHPAPWAEIASDRIIIAVPSDHIRALEDPDKLMTLWNRIIDMSADLATLDRSKYRAERIVFDRQTTAGSLHSGYPVCGHIGNHSTLAVNYEKLKTEGSWGFFHEYGHNHQHRLWALPGTGETTCNFWSVYLYEELIGIHRNKTHRAVSPLVRLQTRRKYFDSGADFAKNWSMWTALDTYLLIQESFGWEPFQKVFAEYHALPEEEWPKNQQEINDQWVIRFSKACGKNLAPYWKIWNLPMTDLVEKELESLPVWHCKEVEKWK